MGTVVGFGNCQTEGMVRSAAAALGLQPKFVHPSKAFHDPALLVDALRDAEIAFATREVTFPQASQCAAEAGRPDLVIIPTPRIFFTGFHPDVVFPSIAAGDRQDLPMINANSAILLAAFRDELSVADAVSLFRDEVFDALGYFDYFEPAVDAFSEECALDGFDVRPMIEAWSEQGPFVYVPNHPRIHVLGQLALKQLDMRGIAIGCPEAALEVDDPLARHLIWPVYPEIAARLGVGGDYIFRPKRRPGMSWADSAPMDLETFAERTYERYRWKAPDYALFPRLQDPRFQGIARFLPNRWAAKPANPYLEFDDSHWWSKAVAQPAPDEVDPVVRSKFTLGRGDKVATAGSCFAQHLSKRLAAEGFNYFVTETPPDDCGDPQADGYGVFSARFGNIYTVRQLIQLAARAYGEMQPATDLWKVVDGYVDPFRPGVGQPYPDAAALHASRTSHLAAVRRMIEETDVFVFTLGLTEAWVAEADGAVVPMAPGVIKAEVPSGAYVPKNFTVTETIKDLHELVRMFQQRNPRVRIILTVSPVPLIATFEDRHVLVATTHSKSVLRAAAGEIARRYAHVEYFPAYEIITGSFSRGRYFAEDLRQVTEAGVDHVMKVFLRHYGSDAPARASISAGKAILEQVRSETAAGMDIICDEEEIALSVNRGG